jgi:hypothetical protein
MRLRLSLTIQSSAFWTTTTGQWLFGPQLVQAVMSTIAFG